MLPGAVVTLFNSDASELNLKHCKWHGAEIGFEYRAIECTDRPIPVHCEVHVPMNEISGLLLFLMCSTTFNFQETRPSVHQMEYACYRADLLCDSSMGKKKIIFVMYG
jgi:hypothetical protein